jgi:hypothetical protein
MNVRERKEKICELLNEAADLVTENIGLLFAKNMREMASHIKPKFRNYYHFTLQHYDEKTGTLTSDINPHTWDIYSLKKAIIKVNDIWSYQIEYVTKNDTVDITAVFNKTYWEEDFNCSDRVQSEVFQRNWKKYYKIINTK